MEKEIVAISNHYKVQRFNKKEKKWVDDSGVLTKAVAVRIFINYCRTAASEYRFRIIEITVTEDVIISQ